MWWWRGWRWGEWKCAVQREDIYQRQGVGYDVANKGHTSSQRRAHLGHKSGQSEDDVRREKRSDGTNRRFYQFTLPFFLQFTWDFSSSDSCGCQRTGRSEVVVCSKCGKWNWNCTRRWKRKWCHRMRHTDEATEEAVSLNTFEGKEKKAAGCSGQWHCRRMLACTSASCSSTTQNIVSVSQRDCPSVSAYSPVRRPPEKQSLQTSWAQQRKRDARQKESTSHVRFKWENILSNGVSRMILITHLSMKVTRF